MRSVVEPVVEVKSTIVPYFTKDELLAAQREAEEWEFNRQLDPEGLAALSADLVYPVTFTMPHQREDDDEPHVRCFVVLDAEGGFGSIDVTLPRFRSLGRVRVP